MTAHIDSFPDASATNLDGNPDSGFQVSPNWQASSGLPLGVYPRMDGTGSFGVSTSVLPTGSDFTLYVVGTFQPGWVVRADQGPGNFGIFVNGSSLLQTFVNSSAFDNTLITGVTPITVAAHVVALAFTKLSGHFWMYLDAGLEGDRSCSATFLTTSTKVRVGFVGGLSASASYYNRLLMYDRQHTDAQVATVTAALRAQWGF